MESARLIDREHEAGVLRRLADSGQAAIALVRGRRRVGKTFLLSELWDPRRLGAQAFGGTTRRLVVSELGAGLR